MKKIITIFLFLLLTINAFSYKSKIIDTDNEFGGKTEEITEINQKDTIISIRGNDNYLAEGENVFEWINGYNINRKALKLINYYNKSNVIMKDAIYYDQNCDFVQRLNLSYEINYYKDRDNGKVLQPFQKEVFFNEEIRNDKGTLCGVYKYDYERYNTPNQEILHDFGFTVTDNEIFCFGFGIVSCEVRYTDAWARDNGIFKKIIFPCDGFQAHIDYFYTPEYAKKHTYDLSRDYYALPIFPSHIYVKSGNAISHSNNEYGGVTVESTFNSSDIRSIFKGIEKETLCFDGNKTLRLGVLEGQNLHKFQIFFDQGYLNLESGFYKIIDRFDEKGGIISEEIFNDVSRSKYYCFSSFLKNYLPDNCISIKVIYPDNSFKNNYNQLELHYDSLGRMTYQNCILSKEWSEDIDHDTFITECEWNNNDTVDYFGLNCWEVLSFAKTFSSKRKTRYYKNNTLINSDEKDTNKEAYSLDFIKTKINNTPAVLELSLDYLPAYILQFAKTDLEKAYAAFFWTELNMTYKHSWQGNITDQSLLIKLEGICHDHSLMFKQLAQKLGLKSNIAGGCVADGDNAHAWNIVAINGRHYPLDVTCGIFVADPEELLLRYWPENAEFQCIDPPYKTYEEFKQKHGLQYGSLDYLVKEHNLVLDIENNHTICTKIPVLVESKGQWYAATISEQKGVRYLVHYEGYDSSLDEWVSKDRIKWRDGTTFFCLEFE